jgi:hypothetical protein
MGLRFEQDSYIDDGICALGQWDLVKIWAGKWEYDPPPPLQDLKNVIPH